jgi:hypothetical protein
MGRLAVALMVAACLALGAGVQGATAVVPPHPPTLLDFYADTPTEVSIKWTNHDHARSDGIRVDLYQNDVSVVAWVLRDAPGFGTTRFSDGGLQPDTGYCLGLRAYSGSGEDAFSSFSAESERLCTTTPASEGFVPGPVDLLLENIRGREELTVPAGATIAYLIVFRNLGNDAIGSVVVDIATSGVLTLSADQTLVRPGWEASGFTCGSTPPTGAATAGLRCTGGTLKRGQSTDPAILVQVTGPGFGYIHGSVGVSRGRPEYDKSDNLLTLPVRVY